jgi:hypothetical protein
MPGASGRAEGVPGSATPAGRLAMRQGYAQYLRSASAGELALVALPGLAGLVAITAGGGMVGYRQANSGRFLRQNAERS